MGAPGDDAREAALPGTSSGMRRQLITGPCGQFGHVCSLTALREQFGMTFRRLASSNCFTIRFTCTWWILSGSSFSNYLWGQERKSKEMRWTSLVFLHETFRLYLHVLLYKQHHCHWFNDIWTWRVVRFVAGEALTSSQSVLQTDRPYRISDTIFDRHW